MGKAWRLVSGSGRRPADLSIHALTVDERLLPIRRRTGDRIEGSLDRGQGYRIESSDARGELSATRLEVCPWDDLVHEPPVEGGGRADPLPGQQQPTGALAVQQQPRGRARHARVG